MANYNIIFSPTGGTKKVSDILKSGIGGIWTDVNLCIPETQITLPAINQDDICIIAVPSFGGRIPEIAAARLKNLSANGAKAILVCVYGNREYEDTLTELFDEAEKCGFNSIAAISAIAEHSIARQFANGRPDADDESALKSFAEKINDKLKSDANNILGNIPGNHNIYKERGISTAKPETAEWCIGCGICAKGCPAGAISFDNTKSTDIEKCISCMKCISVCPKNARSLNPNVLNAISERLSKVCSERKENELFL